MAHLVEHCLTNAEPLCGTKEPDVYLAGFSAGGSVAVAVAPLFGQVKKILLVSAYDSVGWFFLHGVRRYAGAVYAAYAEGDLPAVVLAMTIRSFARRASAVQARGVPQCDHGFTGETNGRVLSKAYLWAFAGDESFPSPAGGVPLYD
jgi:pimeloyl-ACP methyl ester carboxylesterase